MKTLKSILICFVLCSFLLSCGAAMQSAQERDELTEAIEQADFILNITEITPLGFPSRTSSGEFSLRLKGNVVNTRLPFIGRSDLMAFSDDDISIVFENEKVKLKKDLSKVSRGEYIYEFKGGKGLDKWTVRLQLYNNGRAYVKCMSESGRTMDYVAEILIPYIE